ncbi:aldo/keto reductase [Naasia sp. SYSU D00948]|uniref:aldo/keto reductase n=1 Tax=Naasia sp. SYSU D00948 TaxID=2817379 RepID=UPI001B30D554|nr:aldo/keto reductase [Naasia sp. SYSU D00948]
MRTLERRRLGRTELAVTELCFGTSPLAFPQLYGYEVAEERAVETVLAAFDSPVRFLDTSNGYGADGESEKRIGDAIRRRGGLPHDYLLATKVDPASDDPDFSGARVRRSFEESLERLGVDRIELLHFHDPERISFEEAMAPDGAVPALVALKEEGLVDHLGVAGGPIDLLRRYVETEIFDVVLSHNRYTLLDRSAEPLMEDAARLDVGFLNAAPYGGGMLSKGPSTTAKYAYGERESVRQAALRMEDACRRHEVPLAAAALQFSTRDPRVASTVVGISAPERIDQTLALLDTPIPDELWAELDTLTPPRDTWLDA